jgi:hypothetical protein
MIDDLLAVNVVKPRVRASVPLIRSGQPFIVAAAWGLVISINPIKNYPFHFQWIVEFLESHTVGGVATLACLRA